MVPSAKNTYGELQSWVNRRGRSGQRCTKHCSMPFLDKMTSDRRPPATKGAAVMSANSCTAANTFSTHFNLHRPYPRWVA
jgi:hypothetical protein